MKCVVVFVINPRYRVRVVSVLEPTLSIERRPLRRMNGSSSFLSQTFPRVCSSIFAALYCPPVLVLMVDSNRLNDSPDLLAYRKNPRAHLVSSLVRFALRQLFVDFELFRETSVHFLFEYQRPVPSFLHSV